MLTLAIETATIPGSVAVVLDDQLLASHLFGPAEQTAQWLAPTIKRLFSEIERSLANTELIGCTCGPGSFTGLRIGITTAKMLAYAIGCPAVTLNTLDVIAAQAAVDPHHPLDVILAAHRKQLFVRSFRAQHGAWQPTDETTICEATAWIQRVNQGGRRLVSGTGLDTVGDQLETNVCPVSFDQRSPRAETVAELAMRRCNAGQVDDIWSLKPQYFRRSYAERKSN